MVVGFKEQKCSRNTVRRALFNTKIKNLDGSHIFCVPKTVTVMRNYVMYIQNKKVESPTQSRTQSSEDL